MVLEEGANARWSKGATDVLTRFYRCTCYMYTKDDVCQHCVGCLYFAFADCLFIERFKNRWRRSRQ